MAVADASSIILLAKAGVLEEFASNHDLSIPETVYTEAVERGVEKGAADAYRIQELIREKELISVHQPEEDEVERIMSLFGITGGEATSIALGRQRDQLVLVDDQKGIKACKALEHPYTTAIDVTVRLQELGELSQQEALDTLTKLEEYGWYKASLVENRRNKIKGGDQEQ